MSRTSFVHELQKNKRFLLVRPVLYGISLLYGTITQIRNLLYKYQIKCSRKLDAPVISIGNIIAGGAGKTPTVIWLVQNFPQDFPKTILLSRGYGGDEKELFANSLPNTPHFTGSKRFLSGQKAIKEHGKNILFLLDDGFQHRQLYRDLDILLLDATCPFGYKYMLPRGFLREFLKNLRRADVFILTRCDMVTAEKIADIRAQLDEIAGKKLQLLSHHAPSYFIHHSSKERKALDTFVGKKAYLFCGIGNPNSFRHLVEKQEIEVVDLQIFEDHYSYTEEDLEKIEQNAKLQQADIILTTSKDAVKISQEHSSIWILEIEIQIDSGKEDLMTLIRKCVSKNSL